MVEFIFDCLGLSLVGDRAVIDTVFGLFVVALRVVMSMPIVVITMTSACVSVSATPLQMKMITFKYRVPFSLTTGN